MEAIILAGGFGTRLKSVVQNVPKPMAPVAGRPFLELLLNSLRSKGVTRAILSVGHMSEAIISYFESREAGMSLIYEIESEPLGTGGAIAAALRHVSTDHVFVFNGDTFLDLELDRLAAMWPGDRAPVVVARQVPDTERFGKIEIEEGRIALFSGVGGKGEGTINAGCYLLPTEIFAKSRLPRSFSFEKDFLAQRPPMSLRAYITGGQFIDIGVPDEYRRAQRALAWLAESRN